MRVWSLRQLRRSWGQYAASAAVVAVVSTFAVLLIEAIDVLRRAASSAGLDTGSLAEAITYVGIVFLGVAVLTAAIVVTNTFTTVYAGRLREIALLRLVGATSRQVRRASLLDGALVGLVGALVGIGAGVVIALVAVALVNGATGAALTFGVPAALWLAPMLAGVVATTAAAHAAARQVSRTSPVQAIGAAATAGTPSKVALWIRTGLGLLSFVIGTAVLAVGSLAGLLTPAGVLVAFTGGVLSITGTILAAPALLMPLVRLGGTLLGRRAAVRLAASNLVQEPLRTARTALAVTVGVALITMFVVAGTMFASTLAKAEGGADASAVTTGMLAVVAVLTSFSILVAAIGVASTLSMSVLQRRREIGMLRAVGMTGRQVRRMLLAESLLTTLAGVVAGLLLGTGYGFSAYTSTLASVQVLPPQMPAAYLPVIVVGALLFSLVAALAPGRRASAVPPAEALQAL